jgi:hypothetical protein
MPLNEPAELILQCRSAVAPSRNVLVTSSAAATAMPNADLTGAKVTRVAGIEQSLSQQRNESGDRRDAHG